MPKLEPMTLEQWAACKKAWDALYDATQTFPPGSNEFHEILECRKRLTTLMDYPSRAPQAFRLGPPDIP